MAGEACACAAPTPPRLLPEPEPDHLYDHHSSEEELEVPNHLLTTIVLHGLCALTNTIILKTIIAVLRSSYSSVSIFFKYNI